MSLFPSHQDLSELPAMGVSNVRRLKAIREQIRSTRFDNLPSSMPQHQVNVTLSSYYNDVSVIETSL